MKTAIAMATLALLAGCQPSEPTDNSVSASVEGNRPIPVEPDGGIGDTPDVERPAPAGPLLQPISYAEFSPVVAAGLGCSFTSDDDRLLFVATAPDDRTVRAQGAVKYGGTVGVVNATKPGGYAALQQGGIFAGSDITLNIGRGAGEGSADGSESTKWSATLTVTEVSVGDRSYQGSWSCGA